MSPLRILAAAAALAVLGASVPAANAAPTATVQGRVLDASGRPVKGALVQFRRDPYPAATWFFGCFFWSDDPTCNTYTTTARTDSAGRFRVRVATDHPLGEEGPRRVLVFQPGARTVPVRTELALAFHARSVTLPDLRFWDGEVSVGPELRAARTVVVPPLPPEYGRPEPAPTATLHDGDGGLVWDYAVAPYLRPTDARTVETGTATIVGEQRANLDGHTVTYRSARPVTGAVRPLSRGRACFLYDRKNRPVRLRGCAVTDGVLDRPVGDRYARAVRGCCGRDGALLVDLGAVRSVGAVVVRGCRDDAAVRIEVSRDGTAFAEMKPLPALLDPAVHAGLPVDARYVRVTLDRDCPLSRTSEVSVFAPL